MHRKLILYLCIALLLLEPAVRLWYDVTSAPPVQVAPFDISYSSGYAITEDYPRTDLHVSGGARRTTGQPAVYAHTIWLYGNSVTFGLFVADDDTIASRLQALVPDWRVVNLSTSGQSVRGQLAWLRYTPLRAGDIVIFIDGFTESYFAEHKAIPAASWLLDECDKPQSKRAIVTLYAVGCAVVPLLSLDRAVLQASADDYEQSIDEARRYAATNGVGFYHFLQPGLTGRFPAMGSRLSGVRLEVPQQDYIDINLHVNRAGASLVARTIYDYLSIF